MSKTNVVIKILSECVSSQRKVIEALETKVDELTGALIEACKEIVKNERRLDEYHREDPTHRSVP